MKVLTSCIIFLMGITQAGAADNDAILGHNIIQSYQPSSTERKPALGDNDSSINKPSYFKKLKENFHFVSYPLILGNASALTYGMPHILGLVSYFLLFEYLLPRPATWVGRMLEIGYVAGNFTALGYHFVVGVSEGFRASIVKCSRKH